MKCLSEIILFFFFLIFFFCNYFAKMLNYVMYICYGVFKFVFFWFFGKFDEWLNDE